MGTESARDLAIIDKWGRQMGSESFRTMGTESARDPTMIRALVAK
jgi:hypothetical protein